MLSETLKNDLHQLTRADKLRVLQLLIDDLAIEETYEIVPGAVYEVWSPYDSAEAAAILTKMLEDDAEQSSHA